MRKCLQIGLQRTAEYAYLADEGWVDACVSDPLKTLPDFFKTDPTPFRYFGVDRDFYSLQQLSKEYPEVRYDNIVTRTWCHAYLSGDKTPSTRVHYSSLYQTEPSWICVPTITFSHLLASLRLNRIDVLAMDIEGFEYEIFRDYDWQLKPRFIAVEAHCVTFESDGSVTKRVMEKDPEINTPDTRGDFLIEILEKQGYTLSKRALTNQFKDQIPLTTELQFIYGS